ncbi:MAG TPA: indolepyruvate ferredoxin oxidoreductase subunit alpha [Deltaproteobacteria bacterium]|nr:indolepyruvate ferredoxin oxidoreductase subunit alpha [Deltaproteobacteria bacterium]HNS90063.1 indolepyruvate ferredoxin oxidoreductase subunit alpha [Deltaproteobacteria bacterium]HOA44941.1 indolepyruvate ferredoxin oxidoreductase subunit alpha [Deltaproteobacteria bacterium]HOC76129.1 indolepyruvate ferredoxin oxidoreductase subunit alpha [Deltaproteobacteria bacterium]HOG84542.1 indolepyruvate ferredoxin oxidoreductase subunit alpha [Deltaproteobacteria bacterium]
MKKILSGNEAVARGAWEAGVSFASAYPGTPSTEILETIVKEYPDIHAEWTPNEKVALEVAVGASYTGARALAIMKHVGVNVAADPLMTLPYTLVRGGIVLISADDPELFSSQNEQDNRHYARFAKIALLEPSSSQEAKDFTREAFRISEEYGTPVMVRTTTRISHSMGIVELGDVQPQKAPTLERHPAEWVMLPANARRRHPVIEERVVALRKLAEATPMNRMVMSGTDLGIISSGVAYQYAKEAFPEASFLKLGMPYPFPGELVRAFASKVKELWVVEELDPFMEEMVRALGIPCHGKDRMPLCGELNPDIIRAAVSGETALKTAQPALPGRPPSMCPGCPHRSMLYALRRNKCFIAGDIGCYTLGFLPPLDAIDTCLCMGAGINHAHGMSKVFGPGGQKLAAVIGDSTFYHSGITGLLNLAYNNGAAVIVILDNRTTAMTGAQNHPGTGVTIEGDRTTDIDLEGLVRSLGIQWVRTVNPYEVKNTRAVVKEALETKGPAVIISKAPCVLLKTGFLPGKPLKVDQETCTGCKVCIGLGCPALEFRDEKAHINEVCVGCNVCAELCPAGAIGGDV